MCEQQVSFNEHYVQGICLSLHSVIVTGSLVWSNIYSSSYDHYYDEGLLTVLLHSDDWSYTCMYYQFVCQQAQYGRPPGIKDVLYDERGNVVAVMKISPDKLPSHR